MRSLIPPGTVVGGRYRVVRQLGAGAQATVHEAEIRGLGKRVALKLLEGRGRAAPDAVARFVRETHAIARLSSEHVVHVFDLGRDETHGMFMVMELLDGEGLGDRLHRCGRLGVDEVIAIGLHAACALERVHDAGIVHRDLKPDNLFVVWRDAAAPTVKLLDFGVAKLARATDPSITPLGIVVGTPQYMSPEQVRGERDVDGRADVWSLGAVLFEALAGQPAIDDTGDLPQVLSRICRDGAPPLRGIASWVPAPLAAVVDAALARDRAARIPDARTLMARLRAASAATSRPSWSGHEGALGPGVVGARHVVDFSDMDFDDLDTGSTAAEGADPVSLPPSGARAKVTLHAARPLAKTAGAPMQNGRSAKGRISG